MALTLNDNPTDSRQIRSRLDRALRRQDPDLADRLASRNQKIIIRETRSLRWQDRYLLIVASILLALFLLRTGSASADEAYGLEMASEHGDSLALALNTDVEIEITGLVSRVWVTQVFKNDSLHWMEGTYRFPLPHDAAVDRMQIVVGDRVLEGEIQEKAEAKRVYQQARQNGQTASLVEQQRPNQFQTRLANIGPGEEILVSISFLQPVQIRDGVFSLRLPMTFTPRWGDRADPPQQAAARVVFTGNAAEQQHGLTLNAHLKSDLEMSFVESRYHGVNVHPLANGYHIALDGPWPVTDRDFELIWSPERQTDPAPAVLSWDDGDAAYALLMLVPPAAESVQLIAREVIFVIDSSGSMAGSSLEQASAALIQALDNLQPADYFNIIDFDDDAISLFPESAPASGDALRQARKFIGNLDSDGGTNMLPALQMSLQSDPVDADLRQVIFITDGAVGNEDQLFRQIETWLNDSRLFTVGIGSAPNSYFMRKAAEIGRGTFTHIGHLGEVEVEMAALWDRIQRPALSDICVDWGQPAETYPQVIPDLYAGEPLWLTARFDSLPSAVTICGQYDGRYWQQTYDVQPRLQSENIATLWARSKIAALQDNLLFGQPPEEIKAAVIGLALKHRLLTQYTSMVAVDKTPVRFQHETLDSQTIGSLLPAGSGPAVAFAATAAGWQWQLLLSLAGLLAAGWLYRRSARCRLSYS